MLPFALLRAFPFLFHRAAFNLFRKTLLVTLLLFAIAAVALWTGLRAIAVHFGWTAVTGWAGGAAEGAVAIVIILGSSWLLFRSVAMAVMGLFADDIVAAVEQENYPAAAAAAQPVGWGASVRLALLSLARAIGWNIVALPGYLLLLVTGFGTIGLFLALNAYLLGRDMADLVEPRHPDLPPIPRGSRWLMGLVSALLFLIPLVNLLAPIWSAAMAVHMAHGVRRKAA